MSAATTHERVRRTALSAKSVDTAWTTLFENDLLPTSWHDAPLRRFIHVDAPSCKVCRRITQSPPCRACVGGFERIGEVDRAYPASREACAFFAGNAERLVVVEDAARELASELMSPSDSSTAPIRWKVARERPYGAVALRSRDPVLRDHADSLDRAAVSIESVTPGGITLIAYGVPCACGEADWQLRPEQASRPLGIDDSYRFAEISVDTCAECGATWLEYFFEDHHDDSSRYRGLVSGSLAREVTANTATALIEELPWYWVGGSYFFGKTHRSSRRIH
jgi:hypothetical protein